MITTVCAVITDVSDSDCRDRDIRGRDVRAVALAECDRAAQAMYNSELALHSARQSRVDTWITAAADRLHEAILEHDRTLSVLRNLERSR